LKIRYLWQRRKSVVFTWIVSYAVVLFVPWLISLIIYTQSSDALRSEIHRANDSLLKQARYTIDTQIDLMKRLNMEITWNVRLQSLMYSTKTPGEAQFTAYQFVKEMLTYQTSYASIDEFYVTWDREDAILRSGNVRDSVTAFNTLHDTGEIDYGQWLATIRGSANNTFALLPHMNAVDPKTSIAYITHLPKDLNGRDTGTVVVMANLSRFKEALESISGFSGGQVMILNRDNEVLLSNLPDSIDPQRVIGDLAAGEVAQEDDFELFSIPSSVSDLKYALVIPSNIFWEKAEYVRNFAYASVAISLLGAGVLTLFFVRRNYSPIQQLVESLSDKGRGGEGAEINEINFIRKAISQTRSEKDRMAVQFKLHQNALRSNMLYRLLKGRGDSLVPYEEAFRSFEMKLLSDRFAVILFAVENAENLSSVLPGSDADERLKLKQFIMTNVIEELAERRGHAGYVAEVDEMMACLVNFAATEDSAGFKEDLRELASEAQLFLLHFRMDLTISIGGVHETFPGVAEAYREAVDAMEYKMVLGKREIIAYDDVRVDNAAELQFGYYYPLQLEQQAINWIKSGNYAEASRAMKDAMERNFNKPFATLTLARCLIFNLVGTMVKAINEIGDGENSVFGDNPLWMDKIIACDTVQEMERELFSLLQEVCDFAAAKRETNVSSERAESLRHLAEKVIRHIEENYEDSGLSVNSIGERFDLKGSYLSRLFRNEIGEGLPDYINKLRIDRAKRMIRASRDSISDIAKRVGYNEAATFIRVFKKYEGITPGKFKEMG